MSVGPSTVRVRAPGGPFTAPETEVVSSPSISVTEHRASLVRAHGYRVLPPQSVPLLVCLAVGALLYRGRRTGSRGPTRLAWTLSLVSLAGSCLALLVALFVRHLPLHDGIYQASAVPVGALLAGACATVPRRCAPDRGAELPV